MSVLFLFLALAILTPRDGAVVAPGKPVRLSWQGPSEAVYLVNLNRSGGESHMIAVSNRTDIYVANLELAARFDWSVRQAGSLDEAAAHFMTEATPPRLLLASGLGDFRDVGGWKTTVGRRVRQNVLLRTTSLRAAGRKLTQAEIAAFQGEFGVRTDIDLCAFDGVSGSELGESVRWRRIPFAAGRRIDHAVRGREPFARIFDVVSDRQNHPVLFEGSENGREVDTLTYLLNGLLGVSEQDLARGWTSAPASRQELVDYLKTLPGETLERQIEAYAEGCGIKPEEIAAFRAMMLD